MTPTPTPQISRETLIHGCWPILVIPLLFTIYLRDTPVMEQTHRAMRRAHADYEVYIPDYDFFIVCEVDVPLKEGRLAVFEGIAWIAMMKDKGDDYWPLLAELRAAVFSHITELFPLDHPMEWDDEND